MADLRRLASIQSLLPDIGCAAALVQEVEGLRIGTPRHGTPAAMDIRRIGIVDGESLFDGPGLRAKNSDSAWRRLRRGQVIGGNPGRVRGNDRRAQETIRHFFRCASL